MEMTIDIINQLNPEDQFLLTCLRIGLGDTGQALNHFRYSDFDWNRVYKKINQLAVAPLVYSILNRENVRRYAHGIPNEITRKLRTYYYMTLAGNERNISGLFDILSRFKDENLPAVPLKGSYLIQRVYSDPGMRSMRDVDLLVSPHNFERALRVLFDLGYEYKIQDDATMKYFHSKYQIVDGHYSPDELFNRKHAWPLTNPRGILSLELHWEIGDSQNSLELGTTDLWNRIRYERLFGLNVPVLSPEDLLLHLSVHHAFEHKFYDFGIRSCFDVAMVCQQLRREIDWDLLLGLSKKYDVQKYVYLTMQMVNSLFGISPVGKALETIRPAGYSQSLEKQAINRVLHIDSAGASVTGKNRYPAKIRHLPQQKAFFGKIAFMFKRAFLPSRDLALYYNVPSKSFKVYYYHMVRFMSYLRLYGRYFLYRLMGKNKTVSRQNLDFWLSLPQ